jgi:DNA-directed RNA polymerase specialized sigma24 family protein
MWSASRKKAKHHPVIKAEAEGPHIICLWPGKSANQEGEGSPAQEVTTEEKQTQQDEFLDRVFDSLPESCKMLLKKFYWEHKPMDEIASILHLGNANSAKTKKNRCMNQFKEIANRLLESDEFAEEVIRSCAERAMLRELLEDERIVMKESGIRIAALEVDDEDKPEDK